MGSPRFRRDSQSTWVGIGISVSLKDTPHAADKQDDGGEVITTTRSPTAGKETEMGAARASTAETEGGPAVQDRPPPSQRGRKADDGITIVAGKWDESVGAVDFIREHRGPWGDMMPLVHRCEKLCRDWAIPWARFAARKILKLAKLCSLGRDPHDDELFDCASPVDSLASYHKRPGQQFHGVGGSGRAILAIQTAYRQLRARWLLMSMF